MAPFIVLFLLAVLLAAAFDGSRRSGLMRVGRVMLRRPGE